MNFYQFASTNPMLTFFLFLIAGWVITEVVNAITGYKKAEDINDIE